MLDLGWLAYCSIRYISLYDLTGTLATFCWFHLEYLVSLAKVGKAPSHPDRMSHITIPMPPARRRSSAQATLPVMRSKPHDKVMSTGTWRTCLAWQGLRALEHDERLIDIPSRPSYQHTRAALE